MFHSIPFTPRKVEATESRLKAVYGIEWNMCSPCWLHVAGFYIKKNFKNSRPFCWWLEKKLFVARTFLLALCRRPCPTPTASRVFSIMRPAARPLGHLGHLGHGFKLQAGASGHGHWVIWVIVFLLTQMT